VTAQEARRLWLEHLANERRASPRTLEAYGFAAARYIAFLEQHRGEALTVAGLTQVSAADVRGWLAHLRTGDGPLSPRSLSQALSAIRTFHRFLDRRLDAPNAAIALVRGPRVKPSAPRPVTEDQAAGLIAEPALDPDRDGWEVARDQAVLTLLYGCGLRISEALSLKGRDAPLPDQLRITGKGSKTRIVPVLPAVAEAVQAYRAEAPFAIAADALPG
jgi:integrase/recombinase XerC